MKRKSFVKKHKKVIITMSIIIFLLLGIMFVENYQNKKAHERSISSSSFINADLTSWIYAKYDMYLPYSQTNGVISKPIYQTNKDAIAGFVNDPNTLGNNILIKKITLANSAISKIQSQATNDLWILNYVNCFVQSTQSINWVCVFDPKGIKSADNYLPTVNYEPKLTRFFANII